MALKTASLGWAHRYGEERTGVESDNSISYGVQLAAPNLDENNAGNSARIELVLTPVGQPSGASTFQKISAHKPWRYGSASGFLSSLQNFPLSSRAKLKLNLRENTSTVILIRVKKSSSQRKS
jgi:hypothetical protein